MSDEDQARALKDSLIEFINTKNMINHKNLDLNPYIRRYAQAQNNLGSAGDQMENFGYVAGSKNKKHIIPDF